MTFCTALIEQFKPVVCNASMSCPCDHLFDLSHLDLEVAFCEPYTVLADTYAFAVTLYEAISNIIQLDGRSRIPANIFVLMTIIPHDLNKAHTIGNRINHTVVVGACD
jgi:hypothetical protein